jgi:hypothetical protein
MALTDNCDLFGAIHEEGINRVAQHIMRQRPSLFNYGTELILQRRDLRCVPIEPAPGVIERGDPIMTVVDPLPVLGSIPPVALNFVFQFTQAEIDFHPGDAIALPPELSPPLDAQRFALHAQVCGGLGCPPKDVLQRFLLEQQHLLEQEYRRERPQYTHPGGYRQHLATGRFIARPEVKDREPIKDRPKRPPIVLPTDRMECFCLDLFIVGHVDIVGPVGSQRLSAQLDGIEIVDLRPQEMENSIECYLSLLVQFSILPRVNVALPALVLELLNIGTVTLTPSTAVPNNPAIEEDQLKVFIDIATAPPGPPGPPPPPGPPAPVRTITWSDPPPPPGPSHLTVAASENAVEELFALVRDNFSLAASDSIDFGPFTAGYALALHLEGGDIDLRNDNTIQIDELDIKWDTIQVSLGIDIPEICVGGWCIVPNPFDGCWVRLPEICIFSADPDIGFTLDLSDLITSEISARVRPLTRHGVEATRPPGMSDLDAEDLGIPNLWGVFIDPVTLDIDVFDIADIVGDLLEDAVNAALNGILGPLPQWAKDLILAILGPIIDVIRAILDIPDEIDEWLTDLLGISFGIFDLLLTALADHFALGAPLHQLEDPFPVLPSSGGLIPVKIPIDSLSVEVNADELILAGHVGA